MGPAQEQPVISENPRQRRAEDDLQIVGCLTCRRSFGRGRPVATRFVDATVSDDRDTNFVRTDRFRVRQRDGSRAERYAATISIARCVGVAAGNADAIRLTTLGALEGLPGRRRLQ